MGDDKKALTYIQKALPMAPDKINRDNKERYVKMLQEGKDINQVALKNKKPQVTSLLRYPLHNV